MTLDAFQSDGVLVAQWREVLDMPITKIVLALAAQDAPQFRLIKTDITATFASVRLGHVAGWAEYEKFLTETLFMPPQRIEQLEQTFEPPEEPETE